MIDFFVKLLIYLLPMYIANSSALLFGGGQRLDFGKNFFDNRPLFGKSKTVKGTFLGILAGVIVGALVMVLFRNEVLQFNNYMLLAIMISVGAILGDIASSFAKRRLGFEEGKEFILLDQLDFLAGGIFFGMLVYTPGLYEVVGAIILTFFIHKISNFLAYKMKLKKVPW